MDGLRGVLFAPIRQGLAIPSLDCRKRNPCLLSNSPLGVGLALASGDLRINHLSDLTVREVGVLPPSLSLGPTFGSVDEDLATSTSRVRQVPLLSHRPIKQFNRMLKAFQFGASLGLIKGQGDWLVAISAHPKYIA
jgi:hypothetical protein